MTNRTGRCWIALLLLSAGIASQAMRAACSGNLLAGAAMAGAAASGAAMSGASYAHVGHAPGIHARVGHVGPATRVSRNPVADHGAGHVPYVAQAGDAGIAHASQNGEPSGAPVHCGLMMSCGVATPALPAAVLTSWPPTDAVAEASIPAAGASFLHTAEPPPPRLLLI